MNGPDWWNYMGHLEELEFHRQGYSSSSVKYVLVDVLPKLKKLSFYGMEIGYDGAQFLHHPELTIHSVSQYRDEAIKLEALLPQEAGQIPSSKIKISELYLHKVTSGDYHSETLNLAFVKHIKISTLILSKVKLRGLYNLTDVEPLPSIEARNVTGMIDALFPVSSLFDKPEEIKQKIVGFYDQDQPMTVKLGSVNSEFQDLKRTSMTIVLPNEGARYKTRRRKLLPKNLAQLPRMLTELRFEVSDPGNPYGDSVIKDISVLSELTELRSLTFVGLCELTSRDVGVLSSHPNLKTLSFKDCGKINIKTSQRKLPKIVLQEIT